VAIGAGASAKTLLSCQHKRLINTCVKDSLLQGSLAQVSDQRVHGGLSPLVNASAMAHKQKLVSVAEAQGDLEQQKWWVDEE